MSKTPSCFVIFVDELKEALDIRQKNSSEEDVWRSRLHRSPSIKGQFCCSAACLVEHSGYKEMEG